ncbi:thiamine phosphate synthase [Prevotella sp. FD3004]|jgi:thiamine-phosphate pyrophosphorylase|uniref:thiamine phosphate synthase n=1 Tax=Prevotella sp. FD3004 TaxID=1408309 RepID=UPI001E5EDFF4|nr:thiamine phosphate synthase [Prevotella sp. FD3004]
MLQFISHYTEKYSYLDSITLALQGGCRWIQLRMKDATDDEVRPIAIEAQQLCQKFGATFVIDDRVALVKELQADGVHLGKNDMPIAEARRLLGPDYIIGGTANTFEDVKSHYESGADYIGCGPYRFTTTKQKLSPVLGLDGYRRIIIEMRAAHIDIPIVAIGGITKEDIPAILATGITGIALSGTVLRAANPIDEMKHLTNIVNHE